MDGKFLAVTILVMIAAFSGGISVGRNSVKKAGVAAMSEGEFIRHQKKAAEQDMIRSLMLSEQRAQVRHDSKNDEISTEDREDLIGIIKGAFNND